MRAQVFAETRLTVSAGVSPNAMLSKVAAVSCAGDGRRASTHSAFSNRTRISRTDSGSSILRKKRSWNSRLVCRSGRYQELGECSLLPMRPGSSSFSLLIDDPRRRVSERILQAVGIETVADVYRERGKLFLIVSRLLAVTLLVFITEISITAQSNRSHVPVARLPRTRPNGNQAG